MNLTNIQLLFLKDLFLSRWPLFGYLVGGLLSVILTCLPGKTMGFIGFILIVTVTIAAGIHLIGLLLLGESTEQTRNFVFSLPVSLLDYSVAKISVVLTTFLIPWLAMLGGLFVLLHIIPEAKPGALVPLTLLFLFLLGSFCLQLVTAVVTGSVGWTIVMVVLGNVLFNLFAKAISEHPAIAPIASSTTLTWPPLALQIMALEVAVVLAGLGFAFFWQTRQRDLI